MNIKWSKLILSAASFIIFNAQQGIAQTATSEPCADTPAWVKTNATFEDFDFWIGEWQVYDSKSGQLRGFDDIEAELSGCVVKQHWRQMDDLFSPPGTSRRLQGISLTGIDVDGNWRQMWTDNGGGNLILIGGLEENGNMKLTSEWNTVPVSADKTATIRYIWHWDPISDDEIHNWGFVQIKDDKAEPRKYFDITYRRGVIGGAAATAR